MYYPYLFRKISNKSSNLQIFIEKNGEWHLFFQKKRPECLLFKEKAVILRRIFAKNIFY